ncbi:MAG: hypothetical protein MUF54_15790, partial [Polyangiaceae bacterium]|nr:hypothetical protein [Polyangiaceae bacterium]
ECEAAPLLASTGSARGTLSERVSGTRASCGRNAAGPDRAYRFDVAARSRVRIVQTATGFQPVVHVRRDCGDTASEAGCAEAGMQANEAAFVGLLEPGTYWVYADAVGEASQGTYELTARTASELGGAASGDTCGAAISLADVLGEVQGDTFAARDDIRARCGGEGGGDVAFRIDVQQRARFFARLKAEEGKHKLALQTSCGVAQTELSCGEAVDAELTPGAYWLVVDDAAAQSFGRFRLGYRIQDLDQVQAACAAAPAVKAGQAMTGSTVAAGNRFWASCAGAVDEQAGADRVYSLRIDRRSNVSVKVGSPSFPAVVSLRSRCPDPGSEFACRASLGPGDVALDSRVEPGTYYVVVDGKLADTEGDYSLQVTVDPAK